jgi:hypothetical protein
MLGIIFLVVLTFYLLAIFILPPEVIYEYMHIETMIWILLVILFILWYYFRCKNKPVISTRAKVVSTGYCYRLGSEALFIVPNKKERSFRLTAKQYDSIKEGDTVDLVYQGYVVRSVKVVSEELIRAKVISTKSNFILDCKATFIMPNKEERTVSITDEQYKLIKEGDIVDVAFKEKRLYSVKVVSEGK